MAKPLHEDGPVDFGYGDQAWDTTSSQYTVGGCEHGSAEDFFAELVTADANTPVSPGY